MPLAGRRLMFLVSALAMHEYFHRQQHDAATGRTSTPDATDFISRTNETKN